MARFNRARRFGRWAGTRARFYGSMVRGYGRMAWKRQNVRLIKSPIYYGAAAVGMFTQIDDKYADVIRAVATCPVRGSSIVGTVRMAAQGVVFGEAVSTLAGINAKTEGLGAAAGARLKSVFSK